MLALSSVAALAAEGVIERGGALASLRTPACTANHLKALEAVLPNALLHSLRQHPSAEAQAAALFLAANPAYGLRIGVQPDDEDIYWPRPVILSPAQRMRFEPFDREFLISHAVFHAGSQDERMLLSDAKALDRLADSVAASFIHEISHARELAGPQPYLPHVMDDELVAAYREVGFLLDALAHDANFNRLAEALDAQLQADHEARALRQVRLQLRGARPAARAALQGAERDLAARLRRLAPSYHELVTPDRLDALARLDSLRRSTSAFEAGFAAAYPKTVPYLSWDSSRELAEDSRLLAGVKAAIRDIQRRLASLDPSSRQAEREREKLRRARQVAWTQRQNIQFWSSPERVGGARARYDRLLSVLRAGVHQQCRASPALGRFAAPRPGAFAIRYQLQQ